MAAAIQDLIRYMPKTELHVELEATVRPRTLLRLADRNSVALQADTVPKLAKWFRYRSYTHLLEVSLTIKSCIKTASDIELVCRDFLTNQWNERVPYSEVSCTPDLSTFHDHIDAANRARSWAARELGVGLGLVVQIPRRTRPEEAVTLAEMAAERKGDGVVALGLSCTREGRNPREFSETIEVAAETGIPTIVVATEPVDTGTLLDALHFAEPVRLVVGAGTLRDPELLRYLRTREVAVVLCPTDDVVTNDVPSIADNGLEEILHRNLRITLSSGRPSLLGTNITAQYLLVQRAFNLDVETIQDYVFVGVDTALLSCHDRTELRRRFAARFEQLLPADRMARAGRNKHPST
jgi:aminodeoxyfutalosine deaminase